MRILSTSSAQSGQQDSDILDLFRDQRFFPLNPSLIDFVNNFHEFDPTL